MAKSTSGPPRPARHVAEEQRAGVIGLVDPVAESHDAVAAADGVADPGLGPVGGADGVEHVQGPAGRPAVQGPRQRADGAAEAAARSAPVEVMTRAVKVDELKPWSMVRIRYCSTRPGLWPPGSAPVSIHR